MYHKNSNEKSIGVTLLIPDNIDFEAKVLTVDKEPLFVMLKESTYQENITIINRYAPNNRILKYMKQNRHN